MLNAVFCQLSTKYPGLLENYLSVIHDFSLSSEVESAALTACIIMFPFTQPFTI